MTSLYYSHSFSSCILFPSVVILLLPLAKMLSVERVAMKHMKLLSHRQWTLLNPDYNLSQASLIATCHRFQPRYKKSEDKTQHAIYQKSNNSLVRKTERSKMGK